MTASVVYEGQLHCKATHIQSGTTIETDAPTDNRGKGESFSPTDMVCVALGTCAITTMGIKAMDMDIQLDGATLDIQKHMVSDPRRIGKIDVVIRFPKTLNLSEKDRTILERIGNNCPVVKSLSPEVAVNLVYEW
ncbi:OsmC family protein [Flavihumibacter profundi]|uniref:OsmC family protein n=1 Tax=Flavihumibacter profundi TaxID=2716883 RepID=UPI001CC4F6EF|nr:OsmC family protein [Flavihumibacter profundi]MBZ5856205.1 OsmC family protein [Flavihumibacter profundi]